MQKMRAIMKRTIITVVGKDTVGIIAKVCTYLAKKIQKYEILICKKSLFSLHKQNKEIPYKNS